uniref:Uncharacterized protein n=1 Tax=Fagus sylvatica TaxID=28930 RepID=A0A2N9ERB3_FAGSY
MIPSPMLPRNNVLVSDLLSSPSTSSLSFSYSVPPSSGSSPPLLKFDGYIQILFWVSVEFKADVTFDGLLGDEF